MIDVLKRTRSFLEGYIDFSMAWKGALVLGVVVWLVNLEHGALAALPAALKQATYTYFVAGFITRLCENLAVSWQSPFVALPLAVSIPATIAIGLTFLLHSMKGTPEPLYSTIPTILSAPPAFLWWGLRNRSQRREAESEQPRVSP